ncbi:DUF4390 domain-containing protein [Pseudodesulfovibrio sp. zrk46]|nr:DUF4390 domain-containing protein [Pseudodesulfovibrio sp. zrk46]
MNRNSFRPGRLIPALLVVLLFAASAWAQTLSLMAPSIANENGSLVARYGVTVVEKPILKGELEDGDVLVLKCAIELFKVKEYWPDSTVASDDFESTIKFDRLKKEFIMTLPGRDTPLRNKDIEALLLEGWGSIKANLGSWSVLEKGQEYSLRLITTMNEADAPEGLERFIYFWSWDAGVDNTFHLNFTF